MSRLDAKVARLFRKADIPQRHAHFHRVLFYHGFNLTLVVRSARLPVPQKAVGAQRLHIAVEIDGPLTQAGGVARPAFHERGVTPGDLAPLRGHPHFVKVQREGGRSGAEKAVLQLRAAAGVYEQKGDVGAAHLGRGQYGFSRFFHLEEELF